MLFSSSSFLLLLPLSFRLFPSSSLFLQLEKEREEVGEGERDKGRKKEESGKTMKEGIEEGKIGRNDHYKKRRKINKG